MTGPIRQDINYTKCNAYSAIAHMFKLPDYFFYTSHINTSCLTMFT